MSKLFALLAVSAICFLGGCKSDEAHHDTRHTHDARHSQGHMDHQLRTEKSASATTMKSATDACAHCPGVQTAKADGTCPVCGKKAK